MPVSKKRQTKQRSKPTPPMPAQKKVELAQKKKYTTQQILLMVFSALVVITMATSLIVTGLSGQVQQTVPIATTGPADPNNTPAATTESQTATPETQSKDVTATPK